LQFSALTLDQTNKQAIYIFGVFKEEAKSEFVILNFESHFSFLFQFDQGGNKQWPFLLFEVSRI
jgi:hypothetical protein